MQRHHSKFECHVTYVLSNVAHAVLLNTLIFMRPMPFPRFFVYTLIFSLIHIHQYYLKLLLN